MAKQPAPPTALEAEQGISISDIHINLIPPVLIVPLEADPNSRTKPETDSRFSHEAKNLSGPGALLLRSPYHRVERRRGILVTLTNRRTSGNRLLQLQLRAKGNATTRLLPDWVQWSWSQRSLTTLLGRASVEAQDTLSADGQTLTLLLLPGEKRQANLEFSVPLLPGVRTGDYPFDILVTEADQPGASLRSEDGVVRLQHPETSLLSLLPAIYQDAVSAEEATGEASPPSAQGGVQEYLRLTRSSGRFGDAAGALPDFREAAFFARFLRGFEDMTDPIDAAIGRLYLLFGAETTPNEFLPWLGTWVSLAHDETWPELRRRVLIREAVTLFRWRGTRRGLSRYLEIYSGIKPVIYDQPVRGLRLGDPELATLGTDAARLGNIGPHEFAVILAVPDLTTIRKNVVRAIIDSQKPAHTQYQLTIAPNRRVAPVPETE